MKSLKEKIEVMQHFLNGGEVEYRTSERDWETASTPLWDWLNYDYRKKEYQYPIYVKNKASGYIVRFDDIDSGEVVKLSTSCPYKLNQNLKKLIYWHNKNFWKQVEKPKDKIVIEKWLYKSNKGYYKTCETDNIDKCLNDNYGFGVEKIKLLETYEVEI